MRGETNPGDAPRHMAKGWSGSQVKTVSPLPHQLRPGEQTEGAFHNDMMGQGRHLGHKGATNFLIEGHTDDNVIYKKKEVTKNHRESRRQAEAINFLVKRQRTVDWMKNKIQLQAFYKKTDEP